MSSRPQPQEQKQTWDAAAYAANGRFVADLAEEVFAMLDARPGERILDLGCGDGALTSRIQDTGADVVACDADESMLAAAAQRGLQTVRADMRALPFDNEFDAVFSNAALHWVSEQTAVLTGVHKALRPHGRFVAEMGGLGNIAAIRTALTATLQPYGLDAEAEADSVFPSAEVYCDWLQTCGFRVEYMTLVPRPTPLRTGMTNWLLTFRSGVLQKLSQQDREDAVAATVKLLEPVLCDARGNWWADYVRLRFHAVRC
ncbi:MAG: class I SAM-dependent methyltransferase [Janthinobacterium lividum]